MPQIARVGDRAQGTCTAHKTPISTGATIIAGSPTVTVENKAVARVGDAVQTDCGHISKIVSGSPDITADGIAVARLGDSVADGPFTGTIVSAAATVTGN